MTQNNTVTIGPSHQNGPSHHIRLDYWTTIAELEPSPNHIHREREKREGEEKEERTEKGEECENKKVFYNLPTVSCY